MGSMMQFPDFSNKIVLVYLMGRPPDDGVLLEQAVFEIQGGRSFIIGYFAEGASANDWVAGVRELRSEVGDDISIESVTSETVARLTVRDAWKPERSVVSEPAPPEGVLVVNGTEYGRTILEKLPTVRTMVVEAGGIDRENGNAE